MWSAREMRKKNEVKILKLLKVTVLRPISHFSKLYSRSVISPIALLPSHLYSLRPFYHSPELLSSQAFRVILPSTISPPSISVPAPPQRDRRVHSARPFLLTFFLAGETLSTPSRSFSVLGGCAGLRVQPRLFSPPFFSVLRH